MKQKHQQTLKSLYLQGFRQKNRTLKIVSFLVSYGGCGSRTEKIAVATKQSTGLFLPNSLLSNCPNVAEFGASASSQIPYLSK